MQINESVYNGSANVNEWVLYNNGVALPDHSVITRAVVVIDGTQIIDSQSSPALFNLTLKDRIAISLGQAGIAAGSHSAILRIYDSTNVLFYRWETPIALQVYAV